MRNWGKKLLAIGLVGLLMLAVGGCGKGHSNQVTVKTATAREGELVLTQEITGTLTPGTTANIFSKLTGASVISVNAEVGDQVKAGDILVRLDTKELNAQLNQAEAGVNSVQAQAEEARLGISSAQVGINNAQVAVNNAKSNLETAQKNYDRIQTLVAAGAAPQAQLDQAKNQLDQAQNQVAQASNQLKQAQLAYADAQKKYAIASGPAVAQAEAAANTIRVQISNALIASPINGTITNRNINPGELVNPSAPLLTVADLATLKLQGTVPEEAVPLLQEGQKVAVRVDSFPGRSFTGKITQLGPVATATGQYFPVVIEIANPGELKAGMTARAILKLTAPRGVVVPAAAVKTRQGRSYAFVIRRNTALRRTVTTGLRNNREVAILEGIQPGEQVAVSNVGILVNRMRVIPAGK